ncbi:tail completion or Neck1 protein [Vibrio phage F35 g1]|nr:neck protein [Vibrio phage 115E34-1]
MINIKVDGLQQVQNRIRKEIEKIAKNKTVLVGIHEDAGSTDNGELTMAALGATLHFGADIDHPGGTSYGYKTEKDMVDGKVRFLKSGQGHAVIGVTSPHKIKIPPRPWLDVGVRSGSADYLDIIENNSDDLDRALNMIGDIAVGKVKQYMTELQDPPNAPSTVKKKGSSNPLINNGHLRQSVTYSIIDGKPEEGIG